MSSRILSTIKQVKEINMFCPISVFININSSNEYSYKTADVPCKRVTYYREL